MLTLLCKQRLSTTYKKKNPPNCLLVLNTAFLICITPLSLMFAAFASQMEGFTPLWEQGGHWGYWSGLITAFLCLARHKTAALNCTTPPYPHSEGFSGHWERFPRLLWQPGVICTSCPRGLRCAGLAREIQVGYWEEVLWLNTGMVSPERWWSIN